MATITQCLFCRYPVEPEDRFCQECGAAQLPYVSSVQPSALSKWSNRFLRDGRAQLLLAGFLAGMLCVTISAFTLSSSARNARTSSAAAALSANRLNEAIMILETMSRQGALSTYQQALLDKAYFQRALVYLSNGFREAAKNDLQHVSPRFIQYNEVLSTATRIQDLTGSSAKKHEKPPLRTSKCSTRAVPTGQTRLTAAALAGRLPLPPPPLAEAIAPKETPREEPTPQESQQTAPPSDRNANPGSTWFVSGSQSALPDRGFKTSPDSQQDAQPDRQRDGTRLAARPKDAAGNEKRPSLRAGAAEDDVVRYNRLLARYFSTGHSGDSRSAAETREPPSFREWLDMGRPDF